MSEDVAIKVERVSKNFILPHEKINTLKGLFTSLPKKRLKGREVQHALQDINVEIKKGEFFGILGRNGSGKSTLLKILAGIYQPSAGKVHTSGKLVPFIELGVGFNAELTGRENVYLNGAMLGFSKKEIDAIYDEIVSFAELERFMDQKLKNYSSGMEVRLAFSVAIKAQADILLVDEVLAVGDADFQRKCFDYFKMLKKNKQTVIFVSHDMNAVREFCDRALLIEASHVVAIGRTNEVASQYSRLFINESSEESSAKKGNQKRWGDGRVKVEYVKLNKHALSDQTKELEITMGIKAAQEADDLIAGFVVKDSSGTEICGTNTQIKQLHLPELKAGEHCVVRWTCQNIFAEGNHTIDVAVHRIDGVTVHDWWEEASSFTVKRLEQTGYRVIPLIEVSIT